MGVKLGVYFLEFKCSLQQTYFKQVQKKNQDFCFHIKATSEPDFRLHKGGFDIPRGITNSKDE